MVVVVAAAVAIASGMQSAGGSARARTSAAKHNHASPQPIDAPSRALPPSQQSREHAHTASQALAPLVEPLSSPHRAD